MKMLLPANVGSISVEGTDYTPDADGVVEVSRAADAEALRLHGATEYDPSAARKSAVADNSEANQVYEAMDQITGDLKTATDRVAELEQEVDQLRSRNADLEQQLAAASKKAAEPSTPAVGAQSLDVGADGTSRAVGNGAGVIPPGATVTTTQPQGQAGDTVDKGKDRLAQALTDKPDFDNMNRDQMVAWLQNVGVSVSPSISTVRARGIIDDTVADYQKGLDEAAAERSEHSGESTDADTVVHQ